MADITMCRGGICHLKETCYRYKANKGLRQSFFTELPIVNSKCELYWGINATTETKEEKES